MTGGAADLTGKLESWRSGPGEGGVREAPEPGMLHLAFSQILKVELENPGFVEAT